jgi:flagella basal body P-ring formation protein FlgA
MRFGDLIGSQALIVAALVAIAAPSMSLWPSRTLAEPIIQVKPAVEVDGSKPEITLGDLVEMHGLEAAIASAIRNVRLADMPKQGETRSFTQESLQQILRTQLREASRGDANTSVAKVSLRVPSRVTVARRALRLRPAEIESELRREFRAMCAECEFEIAGLSVPVTSEKIPSGSSWKIRVRSELPRGGFSYPLEVNQEDGTRRTLWVSGTLTVRRNVPVASRAIMIGERVNPEDYNVQSKDVTFATDSAAGANDFSASIVGRQVSAGQIIWRGNLRRETAVHMGDSVKVVVGNEAWQVTTEGVSQTSGYIGDLIRVKIPRTQKIVSGLLKEKGRVEVLQ